MKDQKRFDRFQRWHVTLKNTQAGQSVLADLEKMCGANKTSLVQSVVDGKVDPYYTAFMEGRRSIWIDILNVLTDPPDIPEDEEI